MRGICAAAMALADAGIPMKDLVSAVSVGFKDTCSLISTQQKTVKKKDRYCCYSFQEVVKLHCFKLMESNKRTAFDSSRKAVEACKNLRSAESNEGEVMTMKEHTLKRWTKNYVKMAENY